MTTIKVNPVVEWQLGRLELGRALHDPWNGGWSLLDPAVLHWYGINQEAHAVWSFAGASNSIFDGQQGIARVMRLPKKRLPPGVTCFVEFPTHYVTNVGDEIACRAFLDEACHAFDPAKPVLCGGYVDSSIVVLPVNPTDPSWVGAVYRLRTEEAIDPAADMSDPSMRAKVRSILAANQVIRDRFVLDPIKYRNDATCYALASEDGETMLSVEGYTFTGLLPTRASEVSGPLLRETREESSGSLSVKGGDL
jgi:hypothetical protein